MKGKSGLDVFWSNGYDDGMPCIVTTGTTSADIHFSGQDIHQLSFSLVSPLRTKHDGRCISLSQRAAKRVGYEMGSLPFMMMGGWSLNEPFLRKIRTRPAPTLLLSPMPVFPSNPLRTSPIHATLRKYPGLFGIPFLILMVGASFGLESFTQVRYDLHDQKVQNVRQFILSGKRGGSLLLHS